MRKNLINERENFFHKPQVAINHYYSLNEKSKLISSLYWSGGMGGGTGTYGSMNWDYTTFREELITTQPFENDSLGASSVSLGIVTIGKQLLVYFPS